MGVVVQKQLWGQSLTALAVSVFLLTVLLVSFSWKTINIQSKSTSQNTPVVLNMAQTAASSVSLSSEQEELLVLVWVWPYGAHFPLDVCQSSFGVSGCRLTADRNLYDVADALVVHHCDIMYSQSSLPQKPRPHFQRWVWFNLEPPLIISNLHFLDNLFNFTMTFRQDSDICRPYGRIEALKVPQNFTIPAKSKLVSWVVSKWYDGSPRVKYYEEFKKHIQIDIYGRGYTELSRDDFHDTISKYKFYLSFENSIYTDYITEKFWSNALSTDAVPVALGPSRQSYERFIPGDAFIHVDDFPSPKDLAAYLHNLDKDDERYKKYFNWRSKYRVKMEGGWASHYCRACETLKWRTDYQTIPSVAKWFLEK
uniref:Fucosyltransferase n=1 Tax=Leptobrachium leishanense TaxID=445787 RepID=A0A8C5QBM7_9ANUR